MSKLRKRPLSRLEPIEPTLSHGSGQPLWVKEVVRTSVLGVACLVGIGFGATYMINAPSLPKPVIGSDGSELVATDDEIGGDMSPTPGSNRSRAAQWQSADEAAPMPKGLVAEDETAPPVSAPTPSFWRFAFGDDTPQGNAKPAPAAAPTQPELDLESDRKPVSQPLPQVTTTPASEPRSVRPEVTVEPPPAAKPAPVVIAAVEPAPRPTPVPPVQGERAAVSPPVAAVPKVPTATPVVEATVPPPPMVTTPPPAPAIETPKPITMPPTLDPLTLPAPRITLPAKPAPTPPAPVTATAEGPGFTGEPTPPPRATPEPAAPRLPATRSPLASEVPASLPPNAPEPARMLPKLESLAPPAAPTPPPLAVIAPTVPPTKPAIEAETVAPPPAKPLTVIVAPKVEPLPPAPATTPAPAPPVVAKPAAAEPAVASPLPPKQAPSPAASVPSRPAPVPQVVLAPLPTPVPPPPVATQPALPSTPAARPEPEKSATRTPKPAAPAVVEPVQPAPVAPVAPPVAIAKSPAPNKPVTPAAARPAPSLEAVAKAPPPPTLPRPSDVPAGSLVAPPMVVAALPPAPSQPYAEPSQPVTAPASPAVPGKEQAERLGSEIVRNLNEVLGSRRGQTLEGDGFKDCPTCPSLSIVQPGFFVLGALDTDSEARAQELPAQRARVSRAFALARTEVTIAEYQAFLDATGHPAPPCGNPPGTAPATPVTCVSYQDARAYAHWLGGQTGERYRLPTAAEWEFAAKAGGSAIAPAPRRIAAVGATAQPGPFNAYGLAGMGGGVAEIVADCWLDTLRNAPTDGTAAVLDGRCEKRIVKDGADGEPANRLRFSARRSIRYDKRMPMVGFRVVRELPEGKTQRR